MTVDEVDINYTHNISKMKMNRETEPKLIAWIKWEIRFIIKQIMFPNDDICNVEAARLAAKRLFSRYKTR